MKLYYSPFACSMAAHLVCREAGFDVTLARVDLPTKRVEGGEDLFTVNPMGQVPTLLTDDGAMLTENGAVLSYLADRAPGAGLAPGAGDPARYEFIRWLGFVGSELHKKGLAPVFAPDAPDAVKDYARAAVQRPLAVVDRHLASREGLLGDGFSAADAYLFWALTIAPHGGIGLEPYPALQAFHRRHRARPAVQAALAFERGQHERPFAA